MKFDDMNDPIGLCKKRNKLNLDDCLGINKSFEINSENPLEDLIKTRNRLGLDGKVGISAIILTIDILKAGHSFDINNESHYNLLINSIRDIEKIYQCYVEQFQKKKQKIDFHGHTLTFNNENMDLKSDLMMLSLEFSRVISPFIDLKIIGLEDYKKIHGHLFENYLEEYDKKIKQRLHKLLDEKWEELYPKEEAVLPIFNTAERKILMRLEKQNIKLKKIPEEVLQEMNYQKAMRMLYDKISLFLGKKSNLNLSELAAILKGSQILYNSFKEELLSSLDNMKKLRGGTTDVGSPDTFTFFGDYVVVKRDKANSKELRREYELTKLISELLGAKSSFPIEYINNHNNHDIFIMHKFPGQTFLETIVQFNEFINGSKYKDKEKEILRHLGVKQLLKDKVKLLAEFQEKTDSISPENNSLNIPEFSFKDRYNDRIFSNLEGILDEEILSSISRIASELEEQPYIFGHMDLYLLNLFDSQHGDTLIDFGRSKFTSQFYDLAFLLEQTRLGLDYEDKQELVKEFMDLRGLNYSENISDYHKTSLYVSSLLASNSAKGTLLTSSLKDSEDSFNTYIEQIKFYHSLLKNLQNGIMPKNSQASTTIIEEFRQYQKEVGLPEYIE